MLLSLCVNYGVSVTFMLSSVCARERGIGTRGNLKNTFKINLLRCIVLMRRGLSTVLMALLLSLQQMQSSYLYVLGGFFEA
jgi:hypothetical protein